MKSKQSSRRFHHYLWATYRRKSIDKLQERYKQLYQGIVLDIGGIDRGIFVKPRHLVQRWVFADIDKNNKPDIVLDVTNMHCIETESIDVLNAIEVFEHVEKPELGLQECHRILKKDGTAIFSMPFLYPIHGAPHDFQRWTEYKWKKELERVGFRIEKIEITGRFFMVFCDMIKHFIKSLPSVLRYPCYMLYPILDLLVSLDDTAIIVKNERLNRFHDGYFLILKKVSPSIS